MNLSGLILVVIVALWGSLLVPALVRKHDTVTEVRSVDRFSYALRILSRRTPYVPGRREVLAQRKSAQERRPVVSPAPEFVAELATAAATPAERVAARRRAVAAKRRRTVLLLTLALALCIALALSSGGRWWLTVGISSVLLVMYVTNGRAEAQRQAAIDRRRARARRQAATASARAAVPVRRPAPARVEAPATMAASAMADGSWAPVPVTLPTYVTKPVVAQPTVAPPTGGWFDGVAAEQRAARFASGGPAGGGGDVYDQMNEDEELFEFDQLDDILGHSSQRRRAVND